jgi:hypothetical protein
MISCCDLWGEMRMIKRIIALAEVEIDKNIKSE